MSEKTSEIHRLGDHVLHNVGPAPSGTDHANPSGNPGSEARADTGEHGHERTQPDKTTGSLSEYAALRDKWITDADVLFDAANGSANRRMRLKALLRCTQSMVTELQELLDEAAWDDLDRATPARKEPGHE